jgi:hypothetical protein
MKREKKRKDRKKERNGKYIVIFENSYIQLKPLKKCRNREK